MDRIRPGHHPITDMLAHGRHPLPKDIEDMLRRRSTMTCVFTTEIAMDAYDWERGENLEPGRKKLSSLCRAHVV